MGQTRSSEHRRVESAPVHYLPPCQVKCPLHEDIQRTNILLSLLPEDPILARPAIIRIGDYLYEQNPLFTVCGYVCGLCEQQCHYATKGGAIKRRLLQRFVSDTYATYLPEKPALQNAHDQGQVAIIGGGPAGLAAAWVLARHGYQPSVFEAEDRLGGALWLIPHYRLPADVLTIALASLVRIAGITVRCSTRVGSNGLTLDNLRSGGYQAVFIAKGTPSPRILTFNGVKVPGQELPGVLYGHSLLYEENHHHLPDDYFTGRQVLVIGGGNVAFDAARTAVRLGGMVELVCIESADPESPEHLPAEPAEVKAAMEEGIVIHARRGVSSIHKTIGWFSGITCPRCLAVNDLTGFNPSFDLTDTLELTADVLIIAVGQGPERQLLAREGLLDETGRLAYDPLTLQSTRKDWVFVGGDLRQIGYLAEAMRDGMVAAESIRRYLTGQDLQADRSGQYLPQEMPQRRHYQHEPEIAWTPPEQRRHFQLFERGFTLAEAIAEARRCLACGPCVTCQACLETGLRAQLETALVDEQRCSGCGICTTACPYAAAQLRLQGDTCISVTDLFLCRGCGSCVAACPALARRLVPLGQQISTQEVRHG